MADPIQIYSGIYSGDVIAEDVMQVIYQLTPVDTVLLQRITPNSTRARNIKHEWEVRDLSSYRSGTVGTHIAVSAGETYMLSLNVMEDLKLPSRYANYVEMFRRVVRVTKRAQAVTMHAIQDLAADQLEQELKLFGTNMEVEFWTGSATGPTNNVYGDAGPSSSTSSAGSRMAGVTNAITEQSIGDVITDSAIRLAARNCYNVGATPQDLFSGPTVRDAINALSGTAGTKFLNVSDRRLISTVGVYELTSITLMLHLTRDLDDDGTDAQAAMLDLSQLKPAWLRTPEIEKKPSLGSDHVWAIEAEVTLEFGDPDAHRLLSNIDVTGV